LLIRAILAALLLSLPAYADDGVLIRGMGATSCGKYLESIHNDPDGQLERRFIQWAEGYMSGMNTLGAGKTDSYRDLGGDLEAHGAYLRRYCEQHPLENFSLGVIDLLRTLP
jgi:hypothetical protein